MNFSPEEHRLLHLLIQKKNELILSAFRLFETDNDIENFQETLKHILQPFTKRKLLQRMPVKHSSFYKKGFEGVRFKKTKGRASNKRHRSFV